jgi:hypothetical protein
MGMVDKTKRALAVLQERSNRDREELAMWMRRHSEGLDHDMKKRTSEMMVSTLRQTEDRVSEVKRRAGVYRTVANTCITSTFQSPSKRKMTINILSVPQVQQGSATVQLFKSTNYNRGLEIGGS